MLLLFFSGAPQSGGYVNASTVVSDIWPPLNAASAADAVFWTETEMYEWFNEAARRLAGKCGAFVVRDTSLVSSVGIPSYTLPANHSATIQADLGGQVLRPRNVQELEALDASWPTTDGPPEAFLLDDAQGVFVLTLYPAPDVASSGLPIGLAMRAIPPDVSAAGGFLAASRALRGYFTFYMLGEARAKEGRAQMPEISQWFRQLCGQYEQAICAYLGDS